MLVPSFRFLSFLAGAAIALTTPAFCQVEPSASGGPTANDGNAMMTPPPVSGVPYPSVAGSETRSNYMATSVTISPAYIDNALPNATATPVGDFSVSIAPCVSFDRSTPRHAEQITYSPYFNFYEPTSDLSTVDQSAALGGQFRLSPHVALSIQDSVIKTSNVFNESYPFSNPITGSAQIGAPSVIAPYADQLSNRTAGVLGYQFSANAMVGGGVFYDKFDLLNQSQAVGLYDSNALGGSVFYTRRLNRQQYFGLAYQYNRILAYPVDATSETQTNALLPFYTVYLNQTFSISVSAGIEHIDESETPSFQSSSWSPSVDLSVGWQSKRGSIAGSYSRTVTAGEGLLGAYNSNSVSGSGRWHLSRTWTMDASASYTRLDVVGQTAGTSFSDGSTVTLQVSASRSFNEHLNASFGYQRLTENYSNITPIATDPNSDRVFVSVTYQLSRPLGR
jgi:hypothetical protein